MRFDYGPVVPVGAARSTAALHRRRRARRAVARHAGRRCRRGHARRSADFTVARRRAGAVRAHLAPLARSHRRGARRRVEALDETEACWREWIDAAARTTASGRDAVLRSLITLKALTYAPTGGIVAAADHVAARADRRRAQLGLPLLLAARRDLHPRRAHARRATATRRPRLARLAAARGRRRPVAAADHVRRRPASAASPSSSSAGCPATRARAPVRIGNAAAEQFQLDVYGEVHRTRCTSARRRGPARPRSTPGRSQQALLEFLESDWREPDDGIWEVRGPPRALHALEGDGVGRRSTARCRSVEELGLERPGRPLAARCATRSTPRSARRASTPSRHASPSTTGRKGSTQPAADPARRVPAAPTTRA